jgi:hypothetical protein
VVLADLGVRAPACGLAVATRFRMVAASDLPPRRLSQDLCSGRTGDVDGHAGLASGHANAIEGHPDNVAAAIYGGFVLAYEVGAAYGRAGPFDPPSAQRCSSPTRRWHRGRSRLLPTSSASRRSSQLRSSGSAGPRHGVRAGTLVRGHHDWLHQGYRESAMPRSYELMKSLRGQGFAAMISGAGSQASGTRAPSRSCSTSRSTFAPGFSLPAQSA